MLLERAYAKLSLMCRSTLLNKAKVDKVADDRIVCPITFHPTNLEVVKVLKNNFKRLKVDEEIGHLFNAEPMIAYRRGKNLRDILVRSKLPIVHDNAGTQLCKRSRCVTCHHILKENVVNGPTGSLRVHERFDCVSMGLVYCIVCARCSDLYVGETGRRLGDRFREHRLDVINNKADKEVASHFNRNGHQGIEDMKVMGLYRCGGLVARRLMEQKIIGRLGCVLGRGMNTDFNFVELLQQ